MFDDNSFDTNAFSTSSWLMSFIETVKRKLVRIAKMPLRYLDFPRFKNWR